MVDIWLMMIYNDLVGGIPTPLRNMSSSVGMIIYDFSLCMEKQMFQSTNQMIYHYIPLYTIIYHSIPLYTIIYHYILVMLLSALGKSTKNTENGALMHKGSMA